MHVIQRFFQELMRDTALVFERCFQPLCALVLALFLSSMPKFESFSNFSLCHPPRE